MKLRYLLILSLIALGAALVPSGRQAHAASFTLSGYVYGMDGNPADHVKVCTESTDPGVSENCYTTFQNSLDCFFAPPNGCPGGYSIGLNSGQYRLKVRANAGDGQSGNISQHFSLTTYDPLTVDTNKSVNITIPGHRVSVHVAGFDTANLQGATLTVDSPIQTDTADNPLKIAGLPAYGTSTYKATDSNAPTTDSSGNASFLVLPTSENTPDFAYQVTVQPPNDNYGASVIPPFDVSADTSQSVTLPRALSIQGKVTDGDGGAASGVTIGVENSPGKDYVKSATTDGSGNYSFKVGPGNYYLKVTTSRGGSQQGAASEVLLETSPSASPTAADPNTASKGPIPFTADNSALNVQLPEHKVTLNVTYTDTLNQASPTVKPFPNASISTTSNCPLLNLSMDGYPATACSTYREADSNNKLNAGQDFKTDSNGQAVLWLFDNTPYTATGTGNSVSNPYDILIDPHSGYQYGFPCGLITCFANAPLAPSSITNITLSGDQSYNVLLKAPWALVSTLVAGDGTTPVTNVTVGVETAPGTDPVSTAKTDGNGHFQLNGLEPDTTYYLKVSAKPGDNPTGVPPSFSLESGAFLYSGTGTATFGTMTLPEHQVTMRAVDGNGNGVSNVKFDATGSCPASSSPLYHATCGSGTLQTSTSGGISSTVSGQYPQLPDSEPATDGSGYVTLWLVDDVAYMANATPEKTSNFLPTILSNATDTSLKGRLQQVFVVHSSDARPFAYNLTMLAARTVSGTISNGSGSASQGVTVTLRSVGTGGSSYPSSQSDASGNYSVKVPSGDTFRLNISASGNTKPGTPQNLQLQTTGSVGPINGDTTLNLTLPTQYVTIHVNDHNGSSIKDATVDASAACPRVATCTQTNVTLATSLPAPNNLMAATGLSSYNSLNDAGTSPRASAATDSSGDAHMWLLQSAPYAYSIHAYPPKGDNNNVPATLSPNLSVTASTPTQTINLGSPLTVSGTLSDNHGGHAEGVTVSFVDTLTGKTLGSDISDTSGAYSVGLPAGSYYVKLTTQPGNGTTRDHTVTQAGAPQFLNLQTRSSYTVSSTSTLNLTVPEYKVSLKVTDPSGAALQDATISASNNCSQQALTASVTFNGATNAATQVTGCSYYQSSRVPADQSGGDGKTNSGGNTQLWLLQSSPGQYTITVQPPKQKPVITPGQPPPPAPAPTMWPTMAPAFSLTADKTLSTIQMLKIIKVSGTVSDGHGHGVGGILMGLESKLGGPFVGSAKTATDGSYSFTLGEGTYRVRLYNAPGAVPSKPAATYGNAPQYLQLESTTALNAMHGDTTVNVNIPEYRVPVNVKTSLGANAGNVVLDATTTCPHTGFNMSVVQAGSTLSLGATGCSTYSTVALNGAKTDGSGNAALWLLPSTAVTAYNITAYPPSGVGKMNSLSGVIVNSTTDGVSKLLTLK